MKQGTKSVKGIGFGFSTVNAGQRVTNQEPQFIVISTEGSFRITPPVSKVLGLEHSSHIMFINNVANIDEAIRNNDETIVAFCEEQGLEYGSPESLIAIHKEFDMWAIAKGIKEFNPKGLVKTVTERLTKSDRTKFVIANYDEMLTQAKESDNEELVETLTREDITKEEVINLLSPFVEAKELPKFKGSKVANPAGMSGTGVSLTFTDTNVWKQLKADMGDDADKLNRIYDLDVDNVQKIQIHNGYELVEVSAIILGDSTDHEPAKVGRRVVKDETADVEFED